MGKHWLYKYIFITIEDVNIYDHRQGYPEKLSIKTT